MKSNNFMGSKNKNLKWRFLLNLRFYAKNFRPTKKLFIYLLSRPTFSHKRHSFAENLKKSYPPPPAKNIP